MQGRTYRSESKTKTAVCRHSRIFLAASSTVVLHPISGSTLLASITCVRSGSTIFSSQSLNQASTYRIENQSIYKVDILGNWDRPAASQ